MRILKVFLFVFVLILAVWVQAEQKDVPAPTQDEIYGMNLYKGYAGSRSCIECHEKFYKLWSTSFHGLSMQPYTAAFAKAKLTAQADDIAIGKYRYRAEISDGAGWVVTRRPRRRTKNTRSSTSWAGRTFTTSSRRSSGAAADASRLPTT